MKKFLFKSFLFGTVFLPFVVQAETVLSVTETSYDAVGRKRCVAVRMNPASFGVALPDKCVPGPVGTGENDFGQDRIVRHTYDPAGQLLKIEQAVGTAVKRDYAAYSYSLNGQKTSETDANRNKTTMQYDGFDRLSKMIYPSKILSVGASSPSDYESFSYDNNGNKISHRRRNGATIHYQYDALNRVTKEDNPSFAGNPDGNAKDLYYTYDLQGRVLTKRFGSHSGAGLSYDFDGLGRTKTLTDQQNITQTFYYSTDGQLTHHMHDGLFYLRHHYDALNRPVRALAQDVDQIYALSYNNLGKRSSFTKGAGQVVSYNYDNIGRLTSHGLNLAGTAYDVTIGFAYNPSSQIVSQSTNNTQFDVPEAAGTVQNRAYNGLNQDASIAAINGYDMAGNMANDGSRTLTYDVYNRLIRVQRSGLDVAYDYDVEGRLQKVTNNGAVKTYRYNGVDRIAEYDGAGNLLRRYVHGVGTDEPVVQLEGTGTGDKRYFVQNYQGSVVALANANGDLFGLYKYGAYGEPYDAGGALQWAGPDYRYTGQTVLEGTGLYYYKARVYDPLMGRFLQTDPIGSDDDINLYAYTGGDPINKTDPTGNCKKFGNIECPKPISESAKKQQKQHLRDKRAREKGGVGVTAGGNADIGALKGKSAQGSGAAVSLTDKNGQQTLVIAKTTGVENKKGELVLGAGTGIGVGPIVTNAQNASDLKGPSETTTVTTPWVTIQRSESSSGIWTASVTVGPGKGFSVTKYETNTEIIGEYKVPGQ